MGLYGGSGDGTNRPIRTIAHSVRLWAKIRQCTQFHQNISKKRRL